MPTSVLWVGLIVAWLVVLVPMLVARHPKVNSVTDATLSTRLLHRGGSARLRLKRKVRPDATVMVDADHDPIDEDLLDEDFAARRSDDLDEPATGSDDLEDSRAYIDYDVEEPDGHLGLDSPTIEIAAAARPIDAAPVDVERPAEPGPAFADDVAAVEDDAAVLEYDEPEVGYQASDDADGAAAEYVEGGYADEAALDDTVDPYVAAPPLRRRGGFDPENDARITQARYRSRQRFTLVLGALAVVALAAAVFKVPFAWYGFGALVGVLVVYLAFLRRTVRIESEIRRRRLARLERARREREREVEVVDGVPSYMRKYGCIVMEIDDEDPAFDHMPRYRADEFDFLRPDEEPDLRQPLPRKVG